MTQLDCETLMSAVLDMGKLMLVSGAEVYRVEDTMIRLLKAYGSVSWQVTAVPSHILVSAAFDGREYTLTRRIDNNDTDLELLHRLNDLSRRLCRETPRPDQIGALINAAKAHKTYTDVQFSAIYAFTSAMFTLFFGGGFADAVISALIACGLYWLKKLISVNGGNRVFVALLCSAYSALLAKIFVHVGLGRDADKIIIGVVMVLIPGIEMVNGFRDFIAGDIQAGLMHLAEALFLGVIIAVGSAGMFMLASILGM